MLLLTHWPFLAAMASFAVFGRVAKKVIAPGKGWRWWFHQTMPLHPVVLGVALSFIPGVPASAGAETWAAKALYFALAGVCSTWAYNVVQQLLAKRGIALEGSTPPPK